MFVFEAKESKGDENYFGNHSLNLLLKIKNKIKCTKFIFYWNQLLNKY
jgi:hypothetical protein